MLFSSTAHLAAALAVLLAVTALADPARPIDTTEKAPAQSGRRTSTLNRIPTINGQPIVYNRHVLSTRPSFRRMDSKSDYLENIRPFWSKDYGTSLSSSDSYSGSSQPDSPIFTDPFRKNRNSSRSSSANDLLGYSDDEASSRGSSPKVAADIGFQTESFGLPSRHARRLRQKSNSLNAISESPVEEEEMGDPLVSDDDSDTASTASVSSSASSSLDESPLRSRPYLRMTHSGRRLSNLNIITELDEDNEDHENGFADSKAGVSPIPISPNNRQSSGHIHPIDEPSLAYTQRRKYSRDDDPLDFIETQTPEEEIHHEIPRFTHLKVPQLRRTGDDSPYVSTSRPVPRLRLVTQFNDDDNESLEEIIEEIIEEVDERHRPHMPRTPSDNEFAPFYSSPYSTSKRQFDVDIPIYHTERRVIPHGAPELKVKTEFPPIITVTDVDEEERKKNEALLTQTTGNPSKDEALDFLYSTESDFFKTIMASGYYEDSKDFVDSPTAAPFEAVREAWGKLNKENVASIFNFIQTYFPEQGSELVDAPSLDWTDNPFFLRKAREDLKPLAKSLNRKWLKFSKKVKNSDRCDTCYSTMLEMDNGFVVPGGRFREIYYWDTYFIIEGLLSSEMHNTARGIIQNFIDFIDRHGFIPNGSRSYYLNRSQPPLLTQMVKLYAAHTHDYDQVLNWLPTLDKEMNFWLKHRSVNIKDKSDGTEYSLYHYNVNNTVARPEAYLRDVEVAAGVPESDHARLFADISSAAESGWDFSSRWSRLNENSSFEEKLFEINEKMTSNEENLTPKYSEFEHLRNTYTSEILPIDLNSIMFSNFKLLSTLHYNNGNYDQGSEYASNAESLKSAINNLFWNSESESYHDFNMTSGDISPTWSLAGFFVHWANATDTLEKTISPFKKIHELAKNFPGGIPTSLEYTGLQWDFPNVWPPLQYAIVKGLDNAIRYEGVSIEEIDSSLDYEEGYKSTPKTPISDFKKEFKDLLETRKLVINRYVSTTYCGWKSSKEQTGEGLFYEKYDTRRLGTPGGGGEYGLVTGFGWTNGVLQWMLNYYQKDIVPLDTIKC